MQNITKILLNTGLLLMSFSLSTAYAEPFVRSTQSPQKSYDFRTSTMTIYKWYLGSMAAMVKGKIKFDAESFSASAKGLDMAASLDLLQAFPKESSEDDIDDSAAKPEIWENAEDFKKKFENLQVEAKKLVSIVGKGDEKAIKAQFKITAGRCSACHKKYKTK